MTETQQRQPWKPWGPEPWEPTDDGHVHEYEPYYVEDGRTLVSKCRTCGYKIRKPIAIKSFIKTCNDAAARIAELEKFVREVKGFHPDGNPKRLIAEAFNLLAERTR